MSNRLASFKGPSTPSSSPVQQRQASIAPSSPARVTESTYHRSLRTLLQEIRSTTETWDDLVLIDGLKAIKSLVDLRTELDNAITRAPNRLPRRYLVGPQLEVMDQRISELDAVLTKLQKQFRKLNNLVENLETLVFEAHKNKGWRWVENEPLWTTWSLEKFASSIPEILIHYHRSLNEHIMLVNILRSHSVSFDESREAISKWAEQPWLEENGWDAKWEDLCSVEIDRWNK
ncbi:hypothetical protein DFH05DRAFT_1502906 [Lentinula detonsa]|uniref:Uncharacterized protein n=1 Tax=Lentinula detonsa TaxID=2804962 RepID=A0A9W8TVI9_9AGAR|nr:hypothetical protein DFH05DRAFT_1502906 [Lentinula detonsa]KAJ3982764.1 hypothetical protein F5890DRAFT_322970 [Lentinula detonsa]